MLRLVSNQAISSIDGSVSLASCLFVSADKGTAIRGRWTLLTLPILWLFVWHRHQRDNCVREITVSQCLLLLTLTGFPILFNFCPILVLFFHHLPTSNFKSEPYLNIHHASTWFGYQPIKWHMLMLDKAALAFRVTPMLAVSSWRILNRYRKNNVNIQ